MCFMGPVQLLIMVGDVGGWIQFEKTTIISLLNIRFEPNFDFYHMDGFILSDAPTPTWSLISS